MDRVEIIINNINKNNLTEDEIVSLHDEIIKTEWTMEERQRLKMSGFTEMLAMLYDGIQYMRLKKAP